MIKYVGLLTKDDNYYYKVLIVVISNSVRIS